MELTLEIDNNAVFLYK